MKSTIDYKNMMPQPVQQTLKLLDKNWMSFFASIKDYKNNKPRYMGILKLPNYKKKDGIYITIFTNQNCKYKDIFIIFPKCFESYNLRTKIKGYLGQIRITPRESNYLLEAVIKKSSSKGFCQWNRGCRVSSN